MTTQTTTTTKAQTTKAGQIAKAKTSKPQSLFFFQTTPAGRLLRAYFVAMIQVQTGDKLKAGASFKLWPSANVRGHLDCKRITRENGAYQLTAAGVNYFTDPTQAPDAEQVKAFAKAIKTGEKFSAYNFAMSPLK